MVEVAEAMAMEMAAAMAVRARQAVAGWAAPVRAVEGQVAAVLVVVATVVRAARTQQGSR